MKYLIDGQVIDVTINEATLKRLGPLQTSTRQDLIDNRKDEIKRLRKEVKGYRADGNEVMAKRLEMLIRGKSEVIKRRGCI